MWHESALACNARLRLRRAGGYLVSQWSGTENILALIELYKPKRLLWDQQYSKYYEKRRLR
jgi:hypothetical protein